MDIQKYLSDRLAVLQEMLLKLNSSSQRMIDGCTKDHLIGAILELQLLQIQKTPIKQLPKIMFKGEKYTLRFGKYENYRHKIELLYGNGETKTHVTINLNGEAMDEDEIAIYENKYFGNDTILSSLIQAKVVDKPHRYVNVFGKPYRDEPIRECEIPICRLLIRP